MNLPLSGGIGCVGGLGILLYTSAELMVLLHLVIHLIG